MPNRFRAPYRAIARRGLIAVALTIGLGLMTAGSAQPQQRTDTNGNAQQTQIQIAPQPKPVVPSVIQNDIDRIAHALEAANNKQPTTDEKQRTERDLEAEENIAKWGMWLVFVGGFEALITAAGVFLVWRTLRASWAAAAAAEKAVTETRRIGEAQVRAYLSIQTVRVQFRNDWLPGEAFPSVEIGASNSGQSPARYFLWRPTIQYISGTERRQRGLGMVWAEAPGASIPTNETYPSRVLIPDMGIVRFAATGISPSGDVLVRVRIEFSYTDVFDQTITGEAYFAGFTRWEGENHPKNNWRPINLDSLPAIRDWDSTEHFHNQ
jgi:hypothetical protein